MFDGVPYQANCSGLPCWTIHLLALLIKKLDAALPSVESNDHFSSSTKMLLQNWFCRSEDIICATFDGALAYWDPAPLHAVNIKDIETITGQMPAMADIHTGHLGAAFLLQTYPDALQQPQSLRPLFTSEQLSTPSPTVANML